METLTQENLEELLRAITEDEIAKNPNITEDYHLDEGLEFDVPIKEKEVNYFNY